MSALLLEDMEQFGEEMLSVVRSLMARYSHCHSHFRLDCVYRTYNNGTIMTQGIRAENHSGVIGGERQQHFTTQ